MKNPLKPTVHIKPEKITFARHLRLNQTPAELALWRELWNRRQGARFYPQVVLYGWIVDFYCPEHRLVIEVDGGIHSKQKDYDLFREQTLKKRHFRILRFKNGQVLFNVPRVIDIIQSTLRECKASYSHKEPSSARERKRYEAYMKGAVPLSSRVL